MMMIMMIMMMMMAMMMAMMTMMMIMMFHLNLSGTDAGPHDDIRQLHQVQDVPLVAAQAHCLCICIAFVSLLFISVSL